MAADDQDQPGRTRNSQPSSQRASRETSPVLQRTISNSASSTVRRQSSTAAIRPSIPVPSPQTSRNTSPIRHMSASNARKSSESSHDASPVRASSSNIPVTSTPTLPSAAAIQRALSATNVPQLNPGSGVAADTATKLSRSPRSLSSTEHAPNSPRLKSPGPSAPSSKRPIQVAKSDAPPVNVQSSTPPNLSHIDVVKAETAEPQLLHTPKTARGPSGPKPSLETVQEATPPADDPATGGEDHFGNFQFTTSTNTSRSSDEDRTPTASIKTVDGPERGPRTAESDNDGNRSDDRSKKEALPSDQPKSRLLPTKSATRAKPDGTRNMTVETETVASIPQSAISQDRSAGGRGDPQGSLRMKPSVETIRPRKERKRNSRKTPSIHNGTASSKADIFEARVASQVDEANSSDSDETFVYESNPPDPHLRVNRNHSRTPSVTSIHSMSDRRGLRVYDNHRVAGKRSMKFSNNPYNIDAPLDPDNGGTIRAQHPRNISRFGRNVGSNPSIYDPDGPFAQQQSNKLRPAIRQSSRPGTPLGPKSPANPPRGFASPWNRKDGATYDFDAEGADDERTPLVGTVRARRSRRPASRIYDDFYPRQEQGFCSRFGGCVLATIVVSMILIGAFGFLFLSNKSLSSVEIAEISNVLASEQELMLDMLIGAVNPNILPVSVADMDLNLFAKSKHLSSSRTLAGGGLQDPDGRWGDGGAGDSQTMLLGRVFTFDQGLYFEGSPLRHQQKFSIGELRLAKPGNETESGGSARWERVLQFPFELILRGVLKYQLPVSGRNVSAAISGSAVVHPEEGLKGGRMRLEVGKGHLE